MQLARIVALGLLIATLGAIAAPTQRQPISPDLIAEPASTIPCAESPFGTAVPIVRDLEPMLQLSGSGGQVFDEYRPSEGAEAQPLQRVYRAALGYEFPILKSVSVDLNGDGRDEVVVAFGDASGVLLVVFSRIAGPTALPIDTWVYSEPLQPNSVDMVAGDLDGSKDKQQELAVSWTVAGGVDNGKVRVVALKGDASAHLVHADNSAAGNYVSATGLTFPRLAVGDFLLTGRDQLVLAAYSPTNSTFVLHLIELDDGSNPASLTTVLPISGQAMRANSYVSYPGGGTTGFYFDGGGFANMQANGQGNGVIEALDADGGDLADTAAAEVVLHVMFPEPVSPVSHVLAQRVLHFVTARSAQNVITGISLGASFAYGDSSIMLERYTGNVGGPNAPPKFAATVADVDTIGGKEIVVARAGHDGTSGPLFGSMVWSAHRAQVRVAPSFQYKNIGLDNGLPVVAFINNSLGRIKTYDWNFGDGAHSAASNPIHKFNSTGIKSITLTVTDFNDVPTPNFWNVNVNGTFDSSPQGQALPVPSYAIDPVPVFTGNADPEYLYSTYFSDVTAIRLAVGDINHDGLPEVLVAVNDNGLGVDTHVFQRQADGNFGRTTRQETLGVTYMDFVLSDFDGDSINAVLSGAAGDCRLVKDKSIRSLTWMPPYFSSLQANSNRAARYGTSSSNSSSIEEQSSSYTGSDVTGYLGVAAEFSIPIVAVKTAEIEFKASLGYNYQVAKGELHGEENEYSIDEGWSLDDDNQSIGQEGLLTTEENTANCYSYNVVTSSGVVPGSALRSCDVSLDKSVTGPGVMDWNRLATGDVPPFISVPIHWFPVQRDWASLALFHVPTAGSAAGPVIFPDAAHNADKATDGLFDTAAESTLSIIDKPYLQIDLGAPRDIHSIRVFPSSDPKSSPGAVEPITFKNSVKDLQGFRLYASATPFSGNNPPTAATATTFVPNGISTFVQDTGAEAVYRTWNVWTGDPNTREPLRTRYLRLQKPADGRIRIAEIQVFGPDHSEPQAFPQAVCDDKVGDGLFKALVYDAFVDHGPRVIEVRGDMMWTGSVNYAGGVPQDSGVPGCENDTSDGTVDSESPDTVRQEPIWQTTTIGAAGSADWSLSQSHTFAQGKVDSLDGATHIGAEFEGKFGPGVQAIVGASVEFTYGITKENQRSLAVGSGFSVSGTTGGFGNQDYFNDCQYSPRPYAFKLTNYSNTGFRHDTYVTDYVVRQKAGQWVHGAIPTRCSIDDRIFADDLENGNLP